VLQQAAKGLLNYNGTGMGVCELSHRGKEFKGIVEKAEGENQCAGLVMCASR
jgi:phosphoserine aminotransferase